MTTYDHQQSEESATAVRICLSDSNIQHYIIPLNYVQGWKGCGKQNSLWCSLQSVRLARLMVVRRWGGFVKTQNVLDKTSVVNISG